MQTRRSKTKPSETASYLPFTLLRMHDNKSDGLYRVLDWQRSVCHCSWRQNRRGSKVGYI